MLASPAPPPMASGRLSRAMIYFATTTAVVACGKEKAPELHDAAMGDPTFTAAPPYGQPPDTAIPTAPEPPPPPPADAGRPDASHPRVVPPYGQPPKIPKNDTHF